MPDEDYDIPDQPNIPEDPVEEDVPGWKDYADAGDAAVLTVAGRLVPRNMDRPPGPGDGADLPAGTGWNEYDTSGDLVQMWRWDGAAWQTLDMSPSMIPVLDVGSQTVGDLTADRIQGGHFTGETFEGGEFVGGEFRTSDTLPGQVEFADDAYMPSWAAVGQTYPGLRVNPIDESTTSVPAGIGSYGDGVIVDGGKATTGESSYIVSNPRTSYMRTHRANGETGGEIYASPDATLLRTFREGGATAGEIQTSTAASFMRTYHEDGAKAGEIQTSPTASYMRTYQADGTTIGGSIRTSPDASRMRTYSGNSSESGWVQVRPQDVELAYVDPSNTYFSRIKADASEAFIYTRAGGASRYLTVDANGVWVKSGSKSYNLEETAQDSGWQDVPLASGISGAGSPAWRNKGGMIYFRGTATATWAQGWNTVATGLPAEMRPAVRVIQNAPSINELGLVWRMGDDGHLEFYKPTAGTRTGELSGLFYPIG